MCPCCGETGEEFDRYGKELLDSAKGEMVKCGVCDAGVAADGNVPLNDPVVFGGRFCCTNS